jgi:DNA processing protein
MKETPRDLLIAWSLLPFLNPNRTRLLLEMFGEPPTAACHSSSSVIASLLSIDHAQAEQVRNPLQLNAARVAALRDSTITLADGDYPKMLRHIIDPPLALHFRGDRTLLDKPSVAIVGSRRASPYAINVARQLGDDLARSGLLIVSGLARGVDAAAHESALDASFPTIAVLGTGIDVVYPRSNRALYRRVAEKGLLLSEFAPGTPPLAMNFPIRNRVISGLTSGTIIVEATSRSGSLITARTAAEQGREVFAVPGSIFSQGSEGTHRLIQYGAKLVHDANDVLEELPGDLRLVSKEQAKEPDSPLREVLAAFTRDEGTDVEQVASRLGRQPSALAEPLLQLELGGWLRALPGARYVRVR